MCQRGGGLFYLEVIFCLLLSILVSAINFLLSCNRLVVSLARWLLMFIFLCLLFFSLVFSYPHQVLESACQGGGTLILRTESQEGEQQIQSHRILHSVKILFFCSAFPLQGVRSCIYLTFRLWATN